MSNYKAASERTDEAERLLTSATSPKIARHSPGPWSVEVWDYSHADPPRKELSVQNSKLLLATVAWDEGKENPYTVQNETAQANARLIAAAPELLKALENLAVWLIAPDTSPETLEYWRIVANDVIDKAKRGQS